MMERILCYFQTKLINTCSRSTLNLNLLKFLPIVINFSAFALCMLWIRCPPVGCRRLPAQWTLYCRSVHMPSGARCRRSVLLRERTSHMRILLRYNCALYGLAVCVVCKFLAFSSTKMHATLLIRALWDVILYIVGLYLGLRFLTFTFSFLCETSNFCDRSLEHFVPKL